MSTRIQGVRPRSRSSSPSSRSRSQSPISKTKDTVAKQLKTEKKQAIKNKLSKLSFAAKTAPGYYTKVRSLQKNQKIRVTGRHENQDLDYEVDLKTYQEFIKLIKKLAKELESDIRNFNKRGSSGKKNINPVLYDEELMDFFQNANLGENINGQLFLTMPTIGGQYNPIYRLGYHTLFGILFSLYLSNQKDVRSSVRKENKNGEMKDVIQYNVNAEMRSKLGNLIEKAERLKEFNSNEFNYIDISKLYSVAKSDAQYDEDQLNQIGLQAEQIYSQDPGVSQFIEFHRQQKKNEGKPFDGKQIIGSILDYQATAAKSSSKRQKLAKGKK